MKAYCTKERLMVFDKRQNQNELSLNGERLEKGQHSNYLGPFIGCEREVDSEISANCKKANCCCSEESHKGLRY